MIVGAHGDDPIIGAGGTTALLSGSGFEVVVLSVCGDRIEGFEEAVRLLGGIPVYLDFEYGEVREERLERELEGILERFEPKLVFTHWKDEILIDHEIVSKVVRKMVRRLDREILMYEIPASSLNFDFDVAFDISNFYDLKREAIEKMRGAFKPEVFENEILPSIAFPPGFRGIQVGAKYAEVFKSVGLRHPLSPMGFSLRRIEEVRRWIGSESG